MQDQSSEYFGKGGASVGKSAALAARHSNNGQVAHEVRVITSGPMTGELYDLNEPWGRSSTCMRRVSAEVFHHYLAYLKTNLGAYLRQARRAQ